MRDVLPCLTEAIKRAATATLQLESEKEAHANTKIELEALRVGLKQSEKEIFKLEKALEEKDAKYNSFEAIAKKQIKDLTQRMKDGGLLT